MAELAVVRFSLKLVWGLVANRAIASLEQGDATEEKLRQLLLSEFCKIHEHLNALRRKELVASTAFMENGYELLKRDPEEAVKEFNKARDAAQVAFGVVADVQDKVLATKIMIASALHEFADKPETATSLCMKYVARLNTVPEIVSAARLQMGHKFGSKLRTWAGGSSHQELLGKVSEVNRCVLQYVSGQSYDWKETGWPTVGDTQTDPVTDFTLLRNHVELTTLPADFHTPVAMTIVGNRFFFAQAQTCSQETDQLLGNSVKVLDMDTRETSDLVGHSGPVLSLTRADTQVVSSSFDKQILVWDAQSLKCAYILSEHEGSVRLLAVNENHLFSCSTDGTILVWDRATFALSYTLKEHTTPVVTIAVSNRHLFSYAVLGETVKYWDLKKWECIHDINISQSVSQMHIVKNLLLIHCDQIIHIFNLGNLKEIGVLRDAGTKSLVVGSRLCTVSDCTLKMWDIMNQKCIGSKVLKSDRGVPYTVLCMYFSEETGFLFVACLVGKAIAVLRI